MKNFIIKHLTLINYIIPIALFIIFCTIFIYTHGTHITCDAKGNCSIYLTCFSDKPIRKVDFIIFDNTKIMCQACQCIQCQEAIKQHHKYNSYLVVKTDNLEKQLQHKLSSERCNLYKEILSNSVIKKDKTLDYYDRRGQWYHIILLTLSLIPGFILGILSDKNRKRKE